MNPSTVKFGRFFLLSVNDEKQALSLWPSDVHEIRKIKSLSSFLRKLAGKYLLLIDAGKNVNCNELSLRRLLKIAADKNAGVVFSDFILPEEEKFIERPLTDYQAGSIRDDFNFGHLLIFSGEAIRSVLQKYGSLPSEADSALYDLRLKVATDYKLVHVPEFLYAVFTDKFQKMEKAGRKKEAHFDYVAKENFIHQKKMERIATNHLKRIGAYLPPRTKKVEQRQDDLQWKASIVIPVLNRRKTIADALNSALKQKTDFPFNIIAVDNYSTDGTTDILKKFAAKYPHVHHVIPARHDLGIGGCWNEAIHSPFCGRYVVQLDSDDLYSAPKTLQKIVDMMRAGNYAMVVGAYTIVNEHLRKIPPGLIAHREWTQANGHNNLLRVNGMGAPRAFDASVLRRIGFPNVSYGEDYAAALQMTREYQVGRIYESLYWCRRWKRNTDAGLSVEQQNRNDFYKDELRSAEIRERQVLNKKSEELRNRIFAFYPGKGGKSLPALCRSLYDAQRKSWAALAHACRDLETVQTRELSGDAYNIILQYNPARAVSSGAAVDKKSIKKRPCFLCRENLPPEQKGILYKKQYLILSNPAPIFKRHFTVVATDHDPQDIESSLASFLRLAADMSPEYAVFYNGPACGASAPDHLHFQAVPKNSLPLLRYLKMLSRGGRKSSIRFLRRQIFDRSVVVLESKKIKILSGLFLRLLEKTREVVNSNEEPPVNVIGGYSENGWRLVVFLRGKHRPNAYFAQGKKRIFVSPGAVDMAGVVITPLLDNYHRLDYNVVRKIYREVSLPEDKMESIIEGL